MCRIRTQKKSAFVMFCSLRWAPVCLCALFLSRTCAESGHKQERVCAFVLYSVQGNSRKSCTSRERSLCGMCWAKSRISFLRRLSLYYSEDVLVRRAHKQVDRLVNALSVAYFGRNAESHFCGGCLMIPGRMY